VLEEIAIGEQTWLKGDVGWFQPMTLPRPLPVRFLFRDLSGYIVSAKCLGPVDIEGKNLIGYELQYATMPEYGILRDQVFVEPGTGLTVRLEQIYPAEHGVITFRYDATIKIEPPKVEANAPEVQVFHLGGAAKKF
jgi:hypothetical protein